MTDSGYLDDIGPSSLMAQLHRHALDSAQVSAPSRRRRARSIGHDSTASDSSYDSEEEERLAQQEWDEGIQQLQLALQVMVCPFFGKWLGRKWSYWAFARYKACGGLRPSFFGLSWLFTSSLLDWANVAIE